MAIVQISKIQQRSGNLVDLPQLDDAEFGWASDDRRLFIGGGPSHGPENVEVLTSYSNISFSQINGSDQGNFNISNAENGQVLTYISDTNTWENYPSTSITDANTNFKLNLGDVSHLRMDGGAIGYVLETDGQGNVSWTPKGTLYTPIIALSNATPIIMTVANTVPYTNGTAITISGANGANANSIVNGQTFYITLATDFATSGNVRLYTDSGRTIAANGTNLGPSTPNVGIATSVVGSAGGGASASGSNTTIQFNTNNLLDGVSGFTFDKVNYTMTVTNGTSGNIISKTINATSSFTGPVFISNTATGTAPLTVSSTTRVANLNVSYANVSDFEVVTTSNSGTFYPVFVSGNTTANYALASNANIAVNAATGNLSATILNANGNVIGGNIITTGYVSTPVVQNGNSNITIDANANINMFVSGNANARVVATATGLNVAGIVTASTLVSNVATGTAPFTVTSTTKVANLNVDTVDGYNTSITSSANTIVVRDANSNIAGNNFSVSTVSATGNIDANNVNASSGVVASTLTSNVATGTAPLTVTSTTRVANLNVNYANVADHININLASTGTFYPVLANTTSGNVVESANANLSFDAATGALSATLLTGTITTNAQPNITSVGNLTSLTVTGNIGANHVNASNSVVARTLTSNVATGTAPLTVTSTTRVSNLNVAYANVSDFGVVTLQSSGTYYLPFISGTATGNYGLNGNAQFSANIANGYLIASGFTGFITTNVITTGDFATAGQITGNWTLTAGSRMQATYADLAEYYEADAHYEPGTVLEFGGDKEVTIAEDGTTRVAGVVSTDPAYAMNANCQGVAVAIALQGRVPTKVRGTIRKGDMMVSAGNGFARPSNSPTMGTVIGKALENFEGPEGVIEIAVGRL